jgi:hypothetical protein
MTFVPLASAPAAAVVICDGEFGPHVGIVYRASKTKPQRVLHLAWHFRLKDELATTFSMKRPLAVVPAFDETELKVLASLCAKRAAFGVQDIPYAFKHKQSSFEDAKGGFVPGAGECGLTCATFVLAMCAWARIRLVDIDSWKTRSTDRAFFAKVIDVLRKSNASPAHIAALELEKEGSVRCRAEEVAAATRFPKAERPVRYELAQPAGEKLAEDYYDAPTD